jgi:hypothetical protein
MAKVKGLQAKGFGRSHLKTLLLAEKGSRAVLSRSEGPNIIARSVVEFGIWRMFLVWYYGQKV